MTPATHSEEAVGQAMAAGFYQALVDAAPDAIIVVDARGVIVLANRICETLLGWTPQDLVGRPLEVVVPPDLRGAHVNHRGGYFARPRTRPMAAGTELAALRADGTRVPVDISLSPIATPEGTVVMAAIRDATQRRRMEAELQASERRWKTSLASMLDAFCILRCVREGDGVVDFEYVYLNAPAARTFGRTAESLIGTRVSQSLPGFPASGRFRDYLQVVETGEPLTSTQHRYAEDNGAAGGVPGTSVARGGAPGTSVARGGAPGTSGAAGGVPEDNHRVEGVFDSQVWKLDDGVAATWRDVSDREASALALRASEERFRASVEDLPDTLSIFAAVRDGAGEIVDFRWQYANRAAGVTFGIRPEDLAGRTLLEVLPDHGPSGIFATYRRVVDTGEPYVEPCLWYEDVWGDGVRRRLAFEMRATKLHDGVVVMARDITSVRIQADDVARHQADLERTNTEIHLLNELAELLQGCLSSAEAYPIAARLSGGLFPGSGGSISITNASRDLVESMATWGEADIGQPAFAPTDCWAVRRGKPHLSGVVEPRCPHLATSSAAWCLCVPMLGQGEAIGVYHLLWAGGPPAAAGEGPLPAAILQPALSVAGQISMATANLKLRDKLRTLSIRDPLTGLFNRRYMEETLTREISLAGRRHTPLSVLQLDIDRFKEFNDAYGHEAGDAVMRHVSQAMQRLFRVSSVACRYGGEEFTIVLPDCALADAVGRAEELRRLLASAGVPHGRTLLAAPTITCGVATFPQHAGTAEGLVGCADAALYAAKAAGRNRVLAYDPTTDRPGPPAP